MDTQILLIVLGFFYTRRYSRAIHRTKVLMKKHKTKHSICIYLFIYVKKKKTEVETYKDQREVMCKLAKNIYDTKIKVTKTLRQRKSTTKLF